MSDLISRQAVIDKIEGIDMQVYEGNAAVGRRTFLTKEEIIYAIENIPSAEPERKWIPVSEALPDEETEVLVTVRFDGTKDMKSSTYVEVAHQIDGEWSSYTDEYKVLLHRHHVIAWMPLPEPWRSE